MRQLTLYPVSETSATPTTSRAPLPEGTLPIAIGLIIAGISSYAFFKVGQQALGKEAFKPIVALWFTTFVFVPGFFLPVEQEVGRALAHRRALGQGSRPVVMKVLPLTVGITIILSTGVLFMAPWLTNDFFEGYGVVTAAMILAFVFYAPTHLSRGIASGSARFGVYGFILGLDGFMRIAACTVLWLLGVDNVGAYALVVAASPILGVIIAGARGGLRTEPGPPSSYSEITPNLGWLLIGSIMSAALVNAGPLGVNILADSSEAAKVTAFGNGVLLSRVPLFLFQAVQAALLPRLARLAAQGDLAEFREGLRRLMIVVTAVGIIGVVGSFALGTTVLDVVYDGGLDRSTLTTLALASAMFMLALAISQAVIALQGHRFVALGWTAGMIGFLLVTAFASDDLYLRVELGLVAGTGLSLIVFILSLRSRISAGATPDVESMIDGVFDNPLE